MCLANTESKTSSRALGKFSGTHFHLSFSPTETAKAIVAEELPNFPANIRFLGWQWLLKAELAISKPSRITYPFILETLNEDRPHR